MGEMERRHQIEKRRQLIRRIALTTVQAAGLIALSVAVPNAMQGFAKLKLLPGARQKESMKRSYARLIEGGYLRYKAGKLGLTAHGERELDRLELQERVQRRPRWDKKWRVLIFDIVERKRRIRDTVRLRLQEVGFVRLQDSVWIYPFDCEDLIVLLKADLRIGFEMRYLIVDHVEGDADLKRHFKL